MDTLPDRTPAFLVQAVWAGTQESTFLASSPVTLMPACASTSLTLSDLH